MKKTLLITSGLILSFALGFAFNNLMTGKPADTSLKRVTGIGGVFFKCKDPAKLKEWYKVHLGLNTNQYGTNFEWRQATDSAKKGYTAWSPFSRSSTYFEKDLMINYRVADLQALVTALRNEGVTIVDTIETYSYGKFVHIMDIEGNKIELWEPYDTEYEKLGNTAGDGVTK